MEPERQSALGLRIAAQRRNVYLTQKQLAERLAVRQSTVSRWETGDVVPALRHRLPLAEALLIAPHVLYSDIDENTAVAS